MKFLVAALALFVGAVSFAHHTPEHQLGYPKFVSKKTHLYDVTLNMTSGVPGLHSQVAKAVINMELRIYAKTPSELILSMHKVRVSDSLPGVGSAEEDVSLKSNSNLEDKLKIPIKAVFEEGMIKSYTLDDKETIESAKIKRSILRNLEVYFDRKVLRESRQGAWPMTYNLTRETSLGNYSSHYVVTSSPYAAFPYESNVFNVSRVDNFEVLPYLAYKTHHNFEKQGCPEVCKRNYTENVFGAGCPALFEPHNTPMKKSFVQHHNLRMVKSGELIIENVETKETHVADVYDQNMEVTIRSVMRFKKTSSETINEPTGQKTYTNLNDMNIEINEKEVEELCRRPEPREAIEAIKAILNKVTLIVLEGSVESEKSKVVGEQLVLLQKALQLLKKGDLRTIQENIVSWDNLPRANEHDKVKRQIWLDNLPIIGTSESIYFLVEMISENMNKPNKAISLWEAKSILEALPMNILEPNGKIVMELSKLLEVIGEPTPGYKMFYSAAHLAVARVIRGLCSVPSVWPEEVEESEESPRNIQRILRIQSEEVAFKKCPKMIVKKFVQEVTRKLKETEDKTKRIIYIETLARTGLKQVLPMLEKYVNGHVVSELTQSYIDYLKTVTIHTLHNLVGKYPKEVQDIVLPVFLNTTEPPKVRTAAFAVLIRCQPTLGTLQLIAQRSWDEPSMEVGSYVTSALETLGNSSLPCHQIIVSRIKKIIPLTKKFDIGFHHAKNMYWSWFDEIRGLGMESRFEHTPSNESFFPSTMYGSLGYNTDSLRDMFFQYAMTSQGLTTKNVWDPLLEILGIKPAENIPKERENEIFPEMNMVPRDPEPWRFVLYNKMFYETSYYYFDAEETTRNEVMATLLEQMNHYINVDSNGNIEGHLLKVWIPSSYHSKAVSKALPYPVEFEMKNPLLISLKFKLQKKMIPGFRYAYSADITPSVYHSTLYTNHILNLGDCKDMGVYHEKRIAATYPIRIEVATEMNGKWRFSYSFPELPKKIFSYTSEAGTYAGKKTLVTLPSVEYRKTIETQPVQFEKEQTFGMIGMPKFVARVLTEDIQLGYEHIPRNFEEAIYTVVKHFLNAGWRRKTFEITRVPDSIMWPTPRSQVQMNVYVKRDYVSFLERSVDEDWSQKLSFEDDLEHKDTKVYSREGEAVNELLTRTLSHIRDEIEIEVEQLNDKTKTVTAFFNMAYRHTLGGFLQHVNINASANVGKSMKPLEMTVDYALAFINRPNEFRYSEQNYGKQLGLALGAISFSKNSPFKNPYVIGKVVFKHEPLDNILRKETNPPVSREQVLPESHEECLKDTREGKALSVHCLKAMREHAIFNRIKLHSIWTQELPSIVTTYMHKADLALKHVLYNHLTTHEMVPHPYGLRLEAVYIDKLTDTPVVDFKLHTPNETLVYSKVPVYPWILPVSSIENVLTTYVREFTNNTYPATCTLMDKYVRTYDLKTFPINEEVPACKYVLSTHCMDEKKFAVVAEIDPRQPGTKNVIIHLGQHEIVLVPGSRSEFRIIFNGQEKRIRLLRPVMLDEEAILFAVANLNSDGKVFVKVHAEKAGLWVVYDGRNVKVQVLPLYKGELCGLCSEYNAELTHELRGVDRCLYSHPADFMRSSMVGSCGPRDPQHPRICPDDEIHYDWSEVESSSEQRGSEPTLRRNIVLSRNNELCFSTKPVPVCENQMKPVATRTDEVDFHCLPSVDRNARKLVTESRRRILGELETKSVDFSEEVEVAKMC